MHAGGARGWLGVRRPVGPAAASAASSSRPPLPPPPSHPTVAPLPSSRPAPPPSSAFSFPSPQPGSPSEGPPHLAGGDALGVRDDYEQLRRQGHGLRRLTAFGVMRLMHEFGFE
eukprot:7202343-Prymnesium_polylepis.1